MPYYKVVPGFVEQIFDDKGKCISQKFVPAENTDVDRRTVNDEQLIDPRIDAWETFYPFEMIQPQEW